MSKKAPRAGKRVQRAEALFAVLVSKVKGACHPDTFLILAEACGVPSKVAEERCRLALAFWRGAAAHGGV